MVVLKIIMELKNSHCLAISQPSEQRGSKAEKINKAVVEMTKNLNLGVDEGDLVELREGVPQQLTNEELLQLEQEHYLKRQEKRELQEKKKYSPLRKFSEAFSRTISDLKELLKKFENTDTDTKRYSLTERNVHCTLSVYKQIYDKKREQTKQTTLDVFLKRVTPLQEEPRAGPS